jgi:diadenosine tetraphosphatase ApaH/serine/threonine PP2A family protein phosphatase
MDNDAIAVFSDVHSNLEAMDAVIADIASMGVERMICLGDIVGYAANPAQCVELVRSLGCPVTKGNHDDAASTDSPLAELRDVARAGIEFSRLKLSMAKRKYLAELPLVLRMWDCEFVHASLEDPPKWNYVLGENDAASHFQNQTEPLCFCGHTHSPMVWQQGEDLGIDRSCGPGRIKLPETGKVLINVGAVGQPRDLNPAACFALYLPKEHAVEFRRVPYDIAKAKRKIMRAKLPRFSAQRLGMGR